MLSETHANSGKQTLIIRYNNIAKDGTYPNTLKTFDSYDGGKLEYDEHVDILETGDSIRDDSNTEVGTL